MSRRDTGKGISPAGELTELAEQVSGELLPVGPEGQIPGRPGPKTLQPFNVVIRHRVLL
jgi:hypothetical protein